MTTGNQKIKVLVVDDEPLARIRMRQLLQKAGDAYVVDEAEDGVQALALIKTFEPDIVYLDVQMPEFSGFDVLAHFDNPGFAVVFQTAYDEYAIKAFEVAAVDYLLKPYSESRFQASLNRALQARPQQGQQLKELERHLRESHAHYMDHIAVKVGSYTKIVPVEDINYFLSQDHITSLYYDKGDYAVDLSLSLLSERLDEQRFLRVHRNAIVNLSKVTQYTKGWVHLKCGAQLKVSRERMKSLVACMNQ